jgi:hypothetical protein
VNGCPIGQHGGSPGGVDVVDGGDEQKRWRGISTRREGWKWTLRCYVKLALAWRELRKVERGWVCEEWKRAGG